jgi:bisphosphoglycerate-dependent phosphoglycerate mutase
LTAKRTLPYYNEKIAPLVEEGKKVLVEAVDNGDTSLELSVDNLFRREVLELLDDRTEPGGESLELTAKRTLPYYNEKIAPLVEEGKKVLVATSGARCGPAPRQTSCELRVWHADSNPTWSAGRGRPGPERARLWRVDRPQQGRR